MPGREQKSWHDVNFLHLTYLAKYFHLLLIEKTCKITPKKKNMQNKVFITRITFF